MSPQIYPEPYQRPTPHHSSFLIRYSPSHVRLISELYHWALFWKGRQRTSIPTGSQQPWHLIFTILTDHTKTPAANNCICRHMTDTLTKLHTVYGYVSAHNYILSSGEGQKKREQSPDWSLTSSRGFNYKDSPHTHSKNTRKLMEKNTEKPTNFNE